MKDDKPAEQIANTVQEEAMENLRHEYKGILKKLTSFKEMAHFDPKEKRYYNINSNTLTLGEIPTLITDYNQLCNLHKDMCKKIEEVIQLAEDKLSNKQQEKRLWGIFKFS